jgi:acetyl-CoA synthetase
MERQLIRKDPDEWTVPPQLIDYRGACKKFSWPQIRADLDGLPDDRGINIAHEAVDRHANGPAAESTAIRWLSKDGIRCDFSYAELGRQSSRFANLLKQLGVDKGERVFVLSGRIPPLYIAALGCWKQLAVFCPLFSAFGPEPIQQRLSRGDARLLLTTEKLYRKKVASLRPNLPELKHVLLVDSEEDLTDDVLSLPKALTSVSDEFQIPATDPEDMAILHFTSGTTGMPKGAVHVHQALLHHYASGRYVLDLRPDDVYWCTADPGWVTGTSYGIIAPLLHRVTSIIDEAEFDSERWYRILSEQQVNIWYTAPTAIRMLMRSGLRPRQTSDLSHLRLIQSVGEPLNPEAVLWGQEVLGLPIHDNWWQTETGGIMIANYRATDIRPGSMGRPLPGIEAGIVRHLEDGSVEEVEQPGVEGELVLRPGWPSMFRTYLHDEDRYRSCFKSNWYLSGDLATRDADGYFWFVGRADDIIKTSGHMVGPFEVESALIEHPAVAEAGVIGRPEPTIGELVKAFVTLNPGFQPSDQLRLELLGFARKRLGSAVAPKEIEFLAQLPRTRSGKIMRRLLKARELGQPEGDVSTLEGL